MVYVAGPPAMQMALGGACQITAPSPPTNHGCLLCERLAEIENSVQGVAGRLITWSGVTWHPVPAIQAPGGVWRRTATSTLTPCPLYAENCTGFQKRPGGHRRPWRTDALNCGSLRPFE